MVKGFTLRDENPPPPPPFQRTTAMSGSQSRTVEAATTLSASFGDFPTVGTTVLGEVGSANTKKHDDEDEDEVEFPDSEEEEEETEELTLLRQEVKCQSRMETQRLVLNLFGVHAEVHRCRERLSGLKM